MGRGPGRGVQVAVSKSVTSESGTADLAVGLDSWVPLCPCEGVGLRAGVLTHRSVCPQAGRRMAGTCTTNSSQYEDSWVPGAPAPAPVEFTSWWAFAVRRVTVALGG